MTEIAFHFNVPDKLEYSCRLLRKAYASGARIVVTGYIEQLSRLDELLWTFSPLEFIPHALLRTGQAASEMHAATPVLLFESPAQCPHQGVLINLDQGIPPEFERFERLIEIVTGEEQDRLAGRSRWKHYAERGYALKRHDVAAPGVTA